MTNSKIFRKDVCMRFSEAKGKNTTCALQVKLQYEYWQYKNYIKYFH